MSLRTVLVTGASQGIGKAIALRLAKDGYNVAIGDLARQETKGLELADEIKSLGRKAVFIPVDVTSKAEVENAVAKTYEELGGFDTIVNNAGVCQVRTLLGHSEEDMRKLMDINVFGVVFGIQAAANKFIELGTPGKIINASSIAGLTGTPLMALYTASKFAVRGLTQTAAGELAAKGITVNCYNPGPVNTAMWDEIDILASKEMGLQPGEATKRYVNAIPLGRSAQPTDIANMVSFLASDQSSYVTGQSFVVDGGLYMH